TTVTATVQDKTGAQPQPCLALQIRGDHRCFVFEEFNLIYSVAEPHLNAVSSGGSGEGLVEVGTRYLKCLRALTRKNFAEAEALPFGTFEKQCGILYLVPLSNYRRQQTCLVENVVAAGQQGLADLKSSEGTRFRSDDTVPGSSEQRSGHAPCGPSTNDQHVSIHRVVIRGACVQSARHCLEKIRRPPTGLRPRNRELSSHLPFPPATRPQRARRDSIPNQLRAARALRTTDAAIAKCRARE